MTTDITKKLNRLRAAAALLPQIEAGYADGKIGREKAALSAEFCVWALSEIPSDAESARLAEQIGAGLKSLEAALSADSERRDAGKP